MPTCPNCRAILMGPTCSCGWRRPQPTWQTALADALSLAIRQGRALAEQGHTFVLGAQDGGMYAACACGWEGPARDVTLGDEDDDEEFQVLDDDFVSHLDALIAGGAL